MKGFAFTAFITLVSTGFAKITEKGDVIPPTNLVIAWDTNGKVSQFSWNSPTGDYDNIVVKCSWLEDGKVKFGEIVLDKGTTSFPASEPREECPADQGLNWSIHARKGNRDSAAASSAAVEDPGKSTKRDVDAPTNLGIEWNGLKVSKFSWTLPNGDYDNIVIKCQWVEGGKVKSGEIVVDKGATSFLLSDPRAEEACPSDQGLNWSVHARKGNDDSPAATSAASPGSTDKLKTKSKLGEKSRKGT